LPGSVCLEGSNPISICTQASREEVFHLAHVVGADLVNAPLGLAAPGSEQEIIDCFASLCEKAKAEGLRVSLEFMPFNQVSNLATAARIVEQAGCDNGGIMFDCWHHHRAGGLPVDILSVPGERFFAIQIDDALQDPMDDIMEETMNHRMLPGAGCIDLVEILRSFKEVGADPALDIEVFNNSLRTLTGKERARLMYESTNALMNLI
jgi:sugar phosphate isomerase/epimerase